MRTTPPPTSVHTVAWVLACVYAHGVRVPWSGSMTFQGVRLPQVDFLVVSLGRWLPLTPANSFPPPPHSSALLSHGFPHGYGGTLCWGLCGRMGSNLAVTNVRLNQQLKVMALEARAGWDITINIWPLAQWYMCLWVPAWNACDLELSVSLYTKLTVSLVPSTQQTQFFAYLRPFSQSCLRFRLNA